MSRRPDPWWHQPLSIITDRIIEAAEWADNPESRPDLDTEFRKVRTAIDEFEAQCRGRAAAANLVVLRPQTENN
jgi:hypothetical protein